MSLYTDLRTMLDAGDKRRRHWLWVMPRDQWEMFRVTSQGAASPRPGAMMVEPAVEYCWGTILGHPVKIDNELCKLRLVPLLQWEKE